MNIESALVVAIITVLLTLGTNFFFHYMTKRCHRMTVKKKLHEELKILLHFLENMNCIYEKKIEKKQYHYGEYYGNLMMPVFDTYYTDVCMYVTAQQAMSFYFIKNMVDELNMFYMSGFHNGKCENPEQCNVKCKRQLFSRYRTLCKLTLSIQEHLKNKQAPFGDEETDKNFQELDRKITEYLNEYQ